MKMELEKNEMKDVNNQRYAYMQDTYDITDMNMTSIRTTQSLHNNRACAHGTHMQHKRSHMQTTSGNTMSTSFAFHKKIHTNLVGFVYKLVGFFVPHPSGKGLLDFCWLPFSFSSWAGFLCLPLVAAEPPTHPE